MTRDNRTNLDQQLDTTPYQCAVCLRWGPNQYMMHMKITTARGKVTKVKICNHSECNAKADRREWGTDDPAIISVE